MQERRAEMDEELGKLQQVQGHLEALEQLAALFPKDHSTRLVIEALKPDLDKAHTAVKEDIGTLRRSLGHGTT